MQQKKILFYSILWFFMYLRLKLFSARFNCLPALYMATKPLSTDLVFGVFAPLTSQLGA